MERYRDPPPSNKERAVTAITLPEHLRRFPCMQPWIGSRYRDERHKRLLVIGESHYLPPESTIHHGPARWYRSCQDDLSSEEVRWASTVGNITGRWYRAHRIYREIQNEIAAILRKNGVTPDEFPLNHVSYCNYFLRPAPVSGGSMEGHARQQDLEVAEEVLTWFILRHRPELVIVTSRFAGGHAERVTRAHGIPSITTPHPGSRWWNTVSRSYGNVRGRDLFTNFLREQHWRVANGPCPSPTEPSSTRFPR